MTVTETAPLASPVHKAIREKLNLASAPLKLAEIVKGLPKPKKKKGEPAADIKDEVREFLDVEVRASRAFAYPSGKDEELRYWSNDEKALLRQKVLDLAAEPQPIAELKKKLA